MGTKTKRHDKLNTAHCRFRRCQHETRSNNQKQETSASVGLFHFNTVNCQRHDDRDRDSKHYTNVGEDFRQGSSIFGTRGAGATVLACGREHLAQFTYIDHSPVALVAVVRRVRVYHIAATHQLTCKHHIPSTKAAHSSQLTRCCLLTWLSAWMTSCQLVAASDCRG